MGGHKGWPYVNIFVRLSNNCSWPFKISPRLGCPVFQFILVTFFWSVPWGLRQLGCSFATPQIANGQWKWAKWFHTVLHITTRTSSYHQFLFIGLPRLTIIKYLWNTLLTRPVAVWLPSSGLLEYAKHEMPSKKRISLGLLKSIVSLKSSSLK